MHYFIFNFKMDQEKVESLLNSMAVAHNMQRKNKEWFLWKFRDNPFGEAILACAEEDGQIVGCVAYGIQNFYYENSIIKGVLSFETFVHPKYQGRGIFSKLLKIGEREVLDRGVKLMLNFPNSNSLKGFLNKDWKKLDVAEYWIKGKSFLTIPFNFSDLRKKFIPVNSNLDLLKFPINFEQQQQNNLYSVISNAYLKWRFYSFPNGAYFYIKQTNCDIILRMGYRGKLKEAQVLYFNIKDPTELKLKEIKKELNYDLISFPISRNNQLRPFLKKSGFIKVPNKTNVCYKILDNNEISDEDVLNISLSAINYHTY